MFFTQLSNNPFVMRPTLANNLKECRVCGDVALCFNFDALCCEACKVFFRRSLVNNFNYKCRQKSKCVIDKWTRNTCKKCRLDKCFEIGMKKQLIEIFREKLNLENKIPPRVEKNPNQLQDFDIKCIFDIQNAMTVFRDERQLQSTGQCNSELTEIINLSAIYLNKTVKYCKQIEAFNSISPKDQLIMLKWFYPELAMLYASYIFNVKQDGLPLSDSGNETVFVKLELGQNLKRNDFYSRNFRSFVLPMNTAMENDCTIRDLLLAQSLFRPRVELGSVEFVQYQHWFYLKLLWRYLKFKYKSLAERKYCSLMCVLNGLEPTSGIFRELIAHEVDKSSIEHVLLELFNLL